jgi:hypothetical protein
MGFLVHWADLWSRRRFFGRLVAAGPRLGRLVFTFLNLSQSVLLGDR